MRDKEILTLSILLITFVALANLVRLYWNIPIHIGAFTLPGWTGALFFLVLGSLAIWSFRALRNLSNHIHF